MNLLLNGLIIIGVCILLASLVPAHHLIAQLPRGRIKRNWYIMRALIIVSIAGYLGYTVINWNQRFGGQHGIGHCLVPLVFLLGACFVYLVNSFALETAQFIRRLSVLEVENITDTLLGIHNRRYLDQRLSQEVKRALRYKIPLSVMLLDIDHFKQINDRFGHQVGDFILTSLGKLILSSARVTDVVARFGGDEIMVIATNTPSSSMTPYAERLRKEISDAILVPPGEFTGGQMIPVTVSIGVAAVGSETETVEALIKSVDEALYQAKSKGRNIVIVNNPEAIGA